MGHPSCHEGLEGTEKGWATRPDSRRIDCLWESCSLLHLAFSNALHSGRLKVMCTEV
jgi:hypothetical protein